MKRLIGRLTAAAFVVALAGPVAAQDAQRVKSGTLSCDVSAGIGLIIGSQKQVQCIFTPSRPGPREIYVGTIGKFGLDLGVTAGGQMVWAVFAPTTRPLGALAGRYSGASAEATVGVGAGINVLVGGSNRTITLQPVSVQGQVGFNLATGVTGLTLAPVR